MKHNLITYLKNSAKSKLKNSILLLFSLQFAQYLYTQNQDILGITKKYFRYDPFQSSFGFFVKHLTEDPALKEKNISKITDSTLYFFEGIYKSHSPFSFKSEKTKVILAERLQPDDSSSVAKSILLYQLAGYSSKGTDGEKFIQDEYRKFYRKYKNGFTDNKSRKFENVNQTYGEICDFWNNDLSFPPVTVAWSSNKDKTENIFVVTVRFIVVGNMAYLPALYEN